MFYKIYLIKMVMINKSIIEKSLFIIINGLVLIEIILKINFFQNYLFNNKLLFLFILKFLLII